MSYEKLFEPIKIGKCEIKNRIAMAPMLMGFGCWTVPQRRKCWTTTKSGPREARD